MAANNLAVVLHKAMDLQMENRSIPEPGKNEVQICMKNTGICGSDVHLWHAGKIGDLLRVEEPVILGHECSGVISKVGEGVKKLKVGDRVSIEPFHVCRDCEECYNGNYNYCPNLSFFATPPQDGSFIQYLVHTADFVYKLPDNVSLEEGALIEPLSVGLHSCRRTRVTLGDKVLILGAGPIGLCVLLVAQAYGAAATIIVDIDQGRLDFAKKLGATYTLKTEIGETCEQTATQIASMLQGRPDKAIECSGAPSCVDLGIEALREGGILGLVGLGSSKISLPLVKVILKEIELVGNCRYRNTWQKAIDMIGSGKIDVKPLITHRFKLEDTPEAFEFAKSGAGVKIMVEFNQ